MIRTTHHSKDIFLRTVNAGTMVQSRANSPGCHFEIGNSSFILSSSEPHDLEGERIWGISSKHFISQVRRGGPRRKGYELCHLPPLGHLPACLAGGLLWSLSTKLMGANLRLVLHSAPKCTATVPSVDTFGSPRCEAGVEWVGQPSLKRSGKNQWSCL